MKKRKLKLFILILILINLIITSPETCYIYADNLEVPVTMQNKGDIAYSEPISTRKQLVKAFIKHVKNLDTDFTLQISYKAIQNNTRAFRGLWQELSEHRTKH